MHSNSIRPRAIAAAVAALVAASGLSANSSFAVSPVLVDDATGPHPAVVGPYGNPNVAARYIVRFVEKPLAQYNSVASSKPVSGIGPVPMRTFTNGRSRLDVHSAQALAYVSYLKDQQHAHLSSIAQALGITVTPRYAMQHALNAVVVELTDDQA